ncbi:hypothetical protein [Mycolicibacterium mengxianglii]|uniref:hypothetical protein n=1 Tax=Mycolicibacterium mengxianglii TaxID=2736649 RepID=UPI0018D093E4|nr:hypothetical protein [Mycolicibacterium mengxianglii]
MRYRLDVIATDVVEVVQYAGGWLFDRAMAGWDVTVLMNGTGYDPLPLQILGAEVLDLEAAIEMDSRRPRPDALAVATDAYGRDSRVQQGVRLALDSGHTEVTLWGQAWPAELASTGSVEHRLSVAARAFKARALAAVAQPVESISGVEVFRSGTHSCCPVVADLVPAS